MINLVNGIDCSNADTTVDIDFILPSSYTSEYTLNNPLFGGITINAKVGDVGDNFFNSLGEAGYCGDGGQG